MGDTVFVGFAVTSHSTSSTATAVIDQFVLTQSSAPPNQLPVVSLTAPAGGSRWHSNVSVGRYAAQLTS